MKKLAIFAATVAMSFATTANVLVSSGSANAIPGVQGYDVSRDFFGKTFNIFDPQHSRCLFAVSGMADEHNCITPNTINNRSNFYYSSYNQIKLNESNICLEAPIRNAGAAVKTATCNGSLGQKWKIISYTGLAATKMRYNLATNDLRFCLSWLDGQNQDYSLRECKFDSGQAFELNYLANTKESKAIWFGNKPDFNKYQATGYQYNESQANLMHMNKQMQSYKIPAGWTVRFYEGKNLTGGYYTRKGESGSDSWVAGKIQSFEILSKN